MSVQRTIDNNEKAKIRATGGYRELSFIKEDVRNYITREVQNVSKLDMMLEITSGFEVIVSLLGLTDIVNFTVWIFMYFAYAIEASNCMSFSVFSDFFRAFRKSSFMDSSLSQSPLLGRHEKHTKESMHAFFNKFITCNRSLIQFVKQYDNCLESREQRERIGYCKFSYCHIVCNKIFNRSSISVNCITRSTQSALGYTVYKVVEQVSNSMFNKFAVTYDAISSEVKCQCLLFKLRGILCHHSLSALSFERVNKVSSRYILERWSKNIKKRHTHIKSKHNKPLLEPRSRRFDNFIFRSQNICEFESESEELTGILHRAYDNAMVEMQ
ncbi:hypothetical protein Ahy_B04g071547 isoform A [Arachis hypogaea]|uniref:Protein FAR1-RELATED SEQUENCE n=1 Tax=Arachis hypogaea TaxID=3818 RepID=A0A444ZL01_ARAHY|nr:hypothetical protein Ahy_B04g071547 isoform A [Arachis hypogaea]